MKKILLILLKIKNQQLNNIDLTNIPFKESKKKNNNKLKIKNNLNKKRKK